MANAAEKYNRYRVKVSRLLRVIEKSKDLFDSLGMSGWIKSAMDLKERLQSDTFKVLIIGEFKRGKSTLINALLGEEILPAFATPCTAVINEIKYGEDKKALLFFRDGVRAQDLAGFPQIVVNHLESSGEGDIPPLAIDIKDLEKYVVIPDPAEDQAKSVAESPYERAEILWPLELCKNGVELIDSPGLNEHGTRTKVTVDYLSSVDAILFVMSCQAVASQSELSVIKNQICSAGHKDIFFIMNRFDQVRKRERDRLVDYSKQKLGEYTTFGHDGLFFVSALEALDGRLDDEPEMVASSGVVEFEEALSKFLVYNRGNIKLRQPAVQIKSGVTKALDEVIPDKLRMLNLKEAELKARYDEIKPELEHLERKQNMVIKRLTNSRDSLTNQVKREVRNRQHEIAHKLKEWLVEAIEGNQLSVKVGFVSSMSTEKSLKELSKEVVTVLSKRIETEQAQWRTGVLEPIICRGMESLTDDLNFDLQEILKDLDTIRCGLTGNIVPHNKDHEISPLERIAAIAGGFVVGGIGSAFVGATMGGKEMLKSLGPQFVLAVTLISLGFSTPLTLIPALLLAGVLQGMYKEGDITNQYRHKTAEMMARNIVEKSDEAGEEAKQSIHEKIQPLIDMVNTGLEREISSIREQAESSLQSLREGQVAREAKQEAINRTKLDLEFVNDNLQDFLVDLDSGIGTYLE